MLGGGVRGTVNEGCPAGRAEIGRPDTS